MCSSYVLDLSKVCTKEDEFAKNPKQNARKANKH